MKLVEYKKMLEYCNINIISNMEVVYILMLSPTSEPTTPHTDYHAPSPISEATHDFPTDNPTSAPIFLFCDKIDNDLTCVIVASNG